MPDMLLPQPSHTLLPHSPTTDTLPSQSPTPVTPLPQPLRNRQSGSVLLTVSVWSHKGS